MSVLFSRTALPIFGHRVPLVILVASNSKQHPSDLDRTGHERSAAPAYETEGNRHEHPDH